MLILFMCELAPAFMPVCMPVTMSTRCRLEVTVILVIHFKHRTVLLGEK